MTNLSLLSRRAAGVAALLLAAGCGSTEPANPDHLSVTSTFGTIGADAAAADVANASAGSGAGTVRVVGSMRLPAPCYDMSARVSSSVNFVVVDIIAERRLAGCTAQVSQVSYTVDVSGIAAGRRTIAYRHTNESAAASSTVEVGFNEVTVR